MITAVVVCLIVLLLILIDGRLARMKKIEREILKEIKTSNDRLNEANKALQWMVDNSPPRQ
jgi:hypothetical protein